MLREAKHLIKPIKLTGSVAVLSRIRILFAAGILLLYPQHSHAEDVKFFRIGTAATSATYYVIGGILANAISNPPGSRPCDLGGSCGVPNLVAVAQTTSGSQANIEMISNGQLESGLVQADLAEDAFNGQGAYKNKSKSDLRAIAALYPDTIHIVVRADSTIRKITDLKGKRVSLGEENSGTRNSGTLVLKGAGLGTQQVKAVFMKPAQAADALFSKQIDAFFLAGGYPLEAVAGLARHTPIRLLSIDPETRARILVLAPEYRIARIPNTIYSDTAGATTLSVRVLWLVNADVPADLVYGITKALWHPSTVDLLHGTHMQGRAFNVKNALRDIGIPLHPAAERYYREQGILPQQEFSPGMSGK